MSVHITEHILERADLRFRELVTETEISEAVNEASRQYKVGQTLVKVKELPHRVRLQNGSSGSVIYAVVDKRDKKDHGRAVTLMIFGKNQQVQTFRAHETTTDPHIVRGPRSKQRYF